MAERLEKASGGLPLDAAPEKVHKTPDPRPHSVELDALRGIGILGILVTHALGPWYIGSGEPLIIPLLNIDLLDLFGISLGPFCLGLFFLLSGYLLTWTESRRASRGNYSLRSYALRRALRLLPAYYMALIVGLLLWPKDPTLTDTLTHLAVLQTFSPDYLDSAFDPAYWYLTSEVLFYALLPLLILKIRGLYPRLALFGGLLAASLAIQAYVLISAGMPSSDSVLPPYYLLHLPLTHLWLFVAGVLLRTMVERLDEKRPGGSWPTLAFSLFAGSLVLLVLAPHAPFVRDLRYLHIIVTDWLAIPFFAAALLGSPVLSKILSWRLLGFVGMISYSLYLLHDTVIVLSRVFTLRPAKPMLQQLDGAAVWLACAGYLGVILVAAGAIAYLSFRYIESPFMRIKPK